MKQVILLAVAALVCHGLQAQEATPAKAPLFTLTGGYTYLYADQGGYRVNLDGWFVKPAVPVGKGYSVFADFTNYYGANHKGSENSHGYTFGLQKTIFTQPKIKPSIFAEAGDVRASNAGSIVNQLSVNAGINFALPVGKHLSLAVTPAEYIFLYPQGFERNDINAKVGITYAFGHR